MLWSLSSTNKFKFQFNIVCYFNLILNLDSSGEDDSDDDEDTNRSQQETHDEVIDIFFCSFLFCPI